MLSLLNGIPHSEVQILYKLRIGLKWRKPTEQFGKKIWFQTIGEEGINSTLKRRIQGIFVGMILYIAKSGGMRCHRWMRQTLLSNVKEPMNLENWFGGLVPMAIGSRVMTTGTKLEVVGK